MRRSLTISAAMHVVVLVALVLSGGWAGRHRPLPPVYRVNLIAAPADATLRRPRERPRRPTEPPPEPATAPEPEPEILEELEEVVPEENTPPPEPEEVEPEPVPEGPETEVEESPAETETSTPDAGGNDAAVDLTVEGLPFPFPGYLERLAEKILREWNQRQGLQPMTATVYFRVERRGRVSGIEIRETSGSFLFDQAAMRTVAEASPLPPLPDGYTGDYLGVSLVISKEIR